MNAIGIDLGGTHLRVGLVRDRHVVARAIERHDGAEPEKIIARIAAIAQDLLGDETPSAIGVGVAGYIRDGVIVEAVNMPAWRGVALRDMLSSAFGVRAAVVMDTAAVAAGEAQAAGIRDRAFVLTVGTGVGGSAIMGGRIIPCEPGFLLDGDAFVEELAAGPAIARAAARANVEEVVEAARAGDALARSALARAGEVLGRAVVNVVHFLLVERIIVGGGVAAADDLLLDPIRRTFEERALPVVKGWCTIERARLGQDAGILGAGSLAQTSTGEGALLVPA